MQYRDPALESIHVGSVGTRDTRNSNAKSLR